MGEEQEDLLGVQLVKNIGAISAATAQFNQMVGETDMGDEFAVTIYFGLLLQRRYPDIADLIFNDWNTQFKEQAASDAELDEVATILRQQYGLPSVEN